MSGFEPAAQEAWGLFWSIFTGDKARRMALMAELNLAPVQCMALMALEPDEPKPMSALADLMQCDNSNVTGIVDRLEAQGLVERRPGERDRRVKEIVLTPRGAAVRQEAQRRLAVPPPVLHSLSRADAEALRDILQRALDSAATPAR